MPITKASIAPARYVDLLTCARAQLHQARNYAEERIAEAEFVPWPALADAWKQHLQAITAEIERRGIPS